MEFCTSIHCMDGRIQEPIQDYLKKSFNVKYVDTITEPGPCKIIAENKDVNAVNSILQRVKISINVHKSHLIAISGHYDCAGNPCDAEVQKEQVKQSIEYLNNLYPNAEIIGLWVDDSWKVNSL
ncbi:MAG: carbonic anhydrase [Candidatus Kariarchaeaceae archaeon]